MCPDPPVNHPTIQPTGYPWAFAFALFGVLLNVAVNQVCVFKGDEIPNLAWTPCLFHHTSHHTHKSLTTPQGMEIVFRRIYGIPFDSQEQHDHDQAEARQEEGWGLLPSTTTSTTNGVASTRRPINPQHDPSPTFPPN